MNIALLPPLNPVLKYLLCRYKSKLLKMPYSNEASRLVDCIDYLLEETKVVRRG